MSLPQQFLDEVRARTSVVQLVQRSVKLTKAGNEWKGCCPFHNEKTPSFYVNDDKAFYHCFGCSAHGDAISWLVEQQGMEFLDAVRQLADAAGMDMPARQERTADRAAGLHDVVAQAARWFSDQLLGMEGGEARAYLQRRGIDEGLAREFGIGFAPDSRAKLRRALGPIGDAQLLQAGLLAQPDDGREPYDRFRGRVIFPIADPKGRAIAFAGRILGQGEPKYLNSPDTPLFDKGRVLFNYHRAAPAARKAGRLIVVEGPMDVIGLARARIVEAMAPQGTALTEAQIALLWRVVPNPVLCFDGDAAGRKASARAAIRALPGLEPGKTLQFVVMPSGTDPDDMTRDGDPAQFEAVLAQALSLSELLWRHEHDAQPLTTPEARAALRERLVAHARTIQHRDLSREYEQEFRAKIDAMHDAMRPKRGRRGQQALPPRAGPVESVDPNGVKRKVVTAVLRGLARHPKVAATEVEQLCRLPIANEAQHTAREAIIDAALAGKAVEVEAIDALFPDDRGYRGLVLSFTRADSYAPLAEADLRQTIDVLVMEAEGAKPDDVVAAVRAYVPPKPPEADAPRAGAKGALL